MAGLTNAEKVAAIAAGTNPSAYNNTTKLPEKKTTSSTTRRNTTTAPASTGTAPLTNAEKAASIAAGTNPSAGITTAAGSPLNQSRDAQVRQAWAARPATERFAPTTSATGPAKKVPHATVSQRLNALGNRISQNEKQLTNIGLQLNRLETAYNRGDYSALDQYNALADWYNKAFETYVSDVEAYNQLYKTAYRDQGVRDSYARREYMQQRQAARDQGARQLYEQRRQEEALRAPQLTTLGKENERVVERTPNRVERMIGAGLSGTASGFTTAAGLTLSNQFDEHDSRTMRRKGASVGEHSQRRISGEEPREAGYTYAVSPAYQQRMARAKLTADGLIDTGRRLNTRSNLQTDIAKEGLGETGQMLVDLGVMAVQMAADIGIAAATGGSMLVPLGIRSYGNGYLTAEQMGFTGDAAQSYALGVAAVEVLSEKMFSVFGIVNKFARGAVTQEMSERVIDGLVKRLASSPGGRTALNRLFTILFSAGSEGLEEVVAGIMEPVIRKYTLDRDVKALKEIDWQETLYEGLLGGILGGLGGAVDLTNTRPTYWKYYKQGINEGIERYEAAVKKNGLESKEALQAAKEVWDGGTRKMNEVAGWDPEGRPVTYHQLAALEAARAYGRQDGEQGPSLADSLNPESLGRYLDQQEANRRQEVEAQRIEEERKQAEQQREEVTRLDTARSAQARDVDATRERPAEEAEGETVRLHTARSAQAQDVAASGVKSGEFEAQPQTSQGVADLSGIPESELTQEEKDELAYGSGAVEDLGRYTGLAQRMGAPLAERGSARVANVARTGNGDITRQMNNLAGRLQSKGLQSVEYIKADPRMNGMRVGNIIFINDRLTGEAAGAAAMGHEVVHFAGDFDAQLINDLIAVMRRQGRDIDGLVETKREIYRKQFAEMGQAWDEEQMNQAYFEEEVAADFIGEICRADSETLDRIAAEEPGLIRRIINALRNMLARITGNQQAVYEQAIDRLNAALEKAGRNENAVRADDGIRYSAIYRTTMGRPVVVVDEDILAGVPREKWLSTVRRNLRDRFPGGIKVPNDLIKVNSRSVRELTFSEYTKYLRDLYPETYADKMRATNNSDEIVAAASGWIDEGPKHSRDDNIVEFARGNVLMRIGENDYDAEVLVATTTNRSMQLHDILDLSPAVFEIEEQTQAAADSDKEVGRRTPASDLEQSITENEGDVKTPTAPEFDLQATIQQLTDQMTKLTEMLSGRTGEAAVAGPAFEQGENQGAASKSYKEYITPEAQARYAADPRFAKWKYKNLAYISAAAWDGVKIPYEVLAEIPELREARERARRESTSLQEKPWGSEPEVDARRDDLMWRLLDYEHGSAVFEDGKIRKVNDEEDFSGPVARERKAFIIIGRPAGGKSSVFANPLSNRHQARIIDSDTVKPWLDGYDDGYGAGYVQDESAEIMERALDAAIVRGENIIIPKIGGKSCIKMAEDLKAEGYTVELYYNDVAEGSSLMRAASRFAEKGRYLDLSYLTSIKDKPEKTFRDNADGGLFDYAEWRNNDVGFGEEPRLVWNSGQGSLGSQRRSDTGADTRGGRPDSVVQGEDEAEGRGATAPRGGRGREVGGTRFSLAEVDPELERARQQAEYWKQLALKNSGVKDVDKLTRDLMRGYGSRASRSEMSGRMRELEEFLRSGGSEAEARATARQMAEDMLNKAAVPEDAADSEYHAAFRRYFRTNSISVPEEVKRGWPDGWGRFRKRYFGRINLKNDGMDVTKIYREASQQWPDLLPSDEVVMRAQDQLETIAEVLDNLEPNLVNPYGSGPEFDAAVDSLAEDIISSLTRTEEAKAKEDTRLQRTEAETEELRQELGIEPETSEEMTAADLMAARKKAEGAKRYLQKTQRRMNLTQQESELVDALIRGTLTEDQLPPGIDRQGVLAVCRAKQTYLDAMAPVDEYNRQRRERNFTLAEQLIENSDEWKDMKNGFAYARETARRIFYGLTKNTEEAQALIDTYVETIRKNEAAKNRMINEYNERIKKLGIDTKTKAGNKVSEAYAVQFVGEAEFMLGWLEQLPEGTTRDGLTYGEVKMLLDEFWRDNPNLDQDRVHAAVAEFRGIYDELFAMVNEARVLNGYAPIDYRKGYFPHFTSDQGDNIIQSLARGMGIGVEVTELPTSIAGTTHLFRPGIQWSGHMLRRTGSTTDYNVLEGWDRYIPAVANIIYHTEDIQKLRALETVIRRKYSDTTVQDEIDATRRSKDMTAEEINAKLDELFKRDTTQLNYFVQWLREYTNQLAGKKAELDRNVEKFVGRKVYRIVQKLENRVAANMLGGNISSAMTNFVPLFQAWGNVSTASMMRAMWDTGVGAIRGNGWRDGSSFLVNRKGYDAMYQTLFGKVKNALFAPFNWVDDFVSETVVRARYYDELRRGLSPEAAMVEADAFAGGVMADRAIGELPTIFNSKNPLVKVFTMFQVEVNNDLSHLLKDIPKDARDKGLAALFTSVLKYMLGVYMFNDLFEWLFGRRVSIDPLSMLNDLAGDATGYELPNMFESAVLIAKGEWQGWEEFENGKGGDFFSDLVGDLKEWADDVPFISGLLGGGRFPIQAMLPEEGAVKAGYAALRDILKPEEDQENPDAYDWNKIYKTVKNPLYYWAMPAFGGQLRKIAEGIYAYTQHGSYSQTKQGKVLQYPILGYDDLVKSMIFGKTTTRYGKEWIESDFDSLTAPQTEAYINLVSGGSDPELIYQILHDLKGTERTAVEKAYALATANLDDGERIMLFGTLDRDKEAENFADLMGVGLSFRQCAEVLDEFAPLKAQAELAPDDDEGKAARRKLATQFVAWMDDQGFDKDTKDLILDKYDMGASPIRYDWLTAAGIRDDGALEMALDWADLTPMAGSDKVTANQKITAVADAGYLSENEKHAAVRTLLSDEVRTDGGSRQTDYDKYVKGYDVSVEVFDQFLKVTTGVKGVDRDGDGKTDSGTKRDAMFAAINSLPLQPGQKTALALYQGDYSESSIRKNAPWLR